MASSINASTGPGGGVATTADASGNLNLQSNGSTVVAMTATGVAVTGTLAVSGGVTLTTTLPVLQGGTGVTTSTGTTNVVLSNSPTLVSPSISSAVMSTMASSVITRDTAKSASGATVDFTGIPSWVNRITVMLSGVSASGTSQFLLQLGTSGGITTTGYVSLIMNGASATTQYTTGIGVNASPAAATFTKGIVTICNLGSNIWSSGTVMSNTITQLGSGTVTLSGTLDRVRLTTVNGTDVYDAGTVNILYE